jgi:hypothetical protein
MAASPVAENGVSAQQQQDNWAQENNHNMGSRNDADPANGVSSSDKPRGPENPEYPRGSSMDGSVSGSKADTAYREKQVKVLTVSSCLLLVL